MNEKQLGQLREIRVLLKNAYDEYVANGDGCWKSSEGAIEVYYPNYFDESYASGEPSGIGVYSYVFGQARMHYFDSFDEALVAVKSWLSWKDEQ